MNTAPSGCMFCLDNQLLKGEILIESANAYAIEPHNNPGRFLIVPKRHAESLEELPDDWWSDFKQVLHSLPLHASSYNVSINYGALAGQTVPHLHFWLVVRSAAADGAASGKGLAKLIDEAGTRPA